MIDVDGLTLSYPIYAPQASYHEVLRDICFTLDSGDALTITGASGSGKSTLLHALAGLAPRHTGGQARGSVRIHGSDVLEHLPKLGEVGLLFQDATTQLFNTTVEQEVAWGLESLRKAPREISIRVDEALSRFSLSDARKRAPWMLSGGQQKRLALALLWAMEPEVLLLDEPMGGLDAVGRSEVLTVFRQLREAGHTLVTASLRPQLMALASHTLLLDAGTPVWKGPSSELLANPSWLVSAGVIYPSDLWPRMPASPGALSADIAVDLEDVSYTYPGGIAALHEISLQIPRGQFVVLAGPNGAGKSTLARHLNGLLRPTRGAVRLFGAATQGRSVGELARTVSYLFQRPEQQLFCKTVRDEIDYGLRQSGMLDCQSRTAAALAQFGLGAVADLPPSMLSYGQQRAVTLASLAAIGAPILILDEPTVGLDGRGWQQLLAWLVECRAQGVTLIVVTHEPELAARADRLILLRQGCVERDGPPDALLPELISQGEV